MPLTRNTTFSRVVVDHIMPDEARVSWTVSPHFLVPGDREFQLQRSLSGEVSDDEWEDVGIPTAGYFAIDDTRLRVGKTLNTVYRVVLQIGEEEWPSPPATSYGLLTPREWLLARRIIRRQLLRQSKRDAVEGWLFKRRSSGETTSTETDFADRATDPLSGLVINSRHPTTVGTEFSEGYYPGTPLMMIIPNTENNLERNMERSMINDSELLGECIAYPGMESRDVWVSKHNDQRYYLIPHKTLSEIRQVPLIVSVKMSPAPTKDAIYQLTVPS